MPSTISCTGCRAMLQVGNAAAGQQVKCPRCQAVVTVPSEAPPLEAAIIEELPASPAPSPAAVTREQPLAAGPTRSCPECGRQIAIASRRCRYCSAWIEEEDDDDDYRQQVQYKPCPRCKATGAKRVVFTFWGSFYGPAMFTHVRCPECDYAYNGRTGGSNLIPAIVFVTIPAVLILGIIGFGFLVCTGFFSR